MSSLCIASRMRSSSSMVIVVIGNGAQHMEFMQYGVPRVCVVLHLLHLILPSRLLFSSSSSSKAFGCKSASASVMLRL